MADIETKQIGEEIAKQVYDLASEEIVTQVKASEAEVRAAALELVSYGMSLQVAYQQAQQIQNRIEASGDNFYNEALRFNRKMVQTYEEFKELMSRVFKLQNIIIFYRFFYYCKFKGFFLGKQRFVWSKLYLFKFLVVVF